MGIAPTFLAGETSVAVMFVIHGSFEERRIGARRTIALLPLKVHGTFVCAQVHTGR